MSASILDGKKLAGLRRNKLKQTISEHIKQGYAVPELAVVLIGDDPASLIYINNKKKACEDVGIRSLEYKLPESTSEQELLDLIDRLNQSPNIDGILVQLPLPAHINDTAVIERIRPDKDIDGFHPYNLGRLALRIPLMRPCTPMGVMTLLDYYNIPVKRQHAVVIGASNIVGRPMCLELLLAGATVTVCHKFTPDLKKHVQSADIIVVAVGKMDIVDTEWLSSKQVLIDVGIHRRQDGSIRGDVDFQKAQEKVAWITPVPGGVGPMTIVSLLENTYFSSLSKSSQSNSSDESSNSS